MTVPGRVSGDFRTPVFDRIRRAFRWSVVASLGAVAVVLGVVSHEIPGRSAGSPATPGSSASVSPGGVSTGNGNGGTGNGGSTGATGGTGSTGNTGSASSSPGVAPPTPTNRAPAAVSGGTSW
jgi:hypothetical protein